MSLRNFRRSKVAPPPAKYDPEWVNQLRRALDELGVDPAVNSPLGLTHDYFPYRLHLVGNLDGLDLSDGTLDGRMLTVGDASGTYGVDYRQLTSPTGSLSIAVTASELQIEQNPSYAASLTAWETLVQTIATGDLLTLYDASEAGLYSLDARGFMDLILAEVPSPYYQYVRDSGGTLLAQESVLGITAPLKATDAAPDTTLKLAATAADKYLYSTAIDTWAEGAITAFGRSLLDDADATAGRNTLGASTGVWPATIGGTGQSAYTVGDLLYASTTTALSKLAAGTSGYVLTSGGAGVAPSWAAAAGGAIDGSGAATRVAYWSDADTLTSDADLVFNGTQLLVTGLFVGALTGTPARALEVRSTSAQIRASYDANFYTDLVTVHSAQYGTIYLCGGASPASAYGATSLAIGPGAIISPAVASNGVAIGGDATCYGNGVAVGRNAVAGTSGQNSGVAVGCNASATGGSGYPSVAVGNSATCAGVVSVTVGDSATCAGSNSLTIGAGATCAGAASVSIGRLAVNSFGASVALGCAATTTAANQFVCGSGGQPTTNWYGGKGVTHATPTAWTLNGTGGSGTDISGGDFIVAPGKPTGAGNPGNFLIQFAPAGASGTTLRTLATYADWRIGGLMIGTSGAAGRMLEVRSTSAQQRWSYDATFEWELAVASDGANKWATNSTSVGSTELEATRNITGAVTDGYAGSLLLDPGYTAASALTVTRHNYLDAQNVSVAGAGPAAVTDACLVRFDAAAGTHKATVGATTKTTPGGVDAWIKININGTIYYVPAYTSTTA